MEDIMHKTIATLIFGLAISLIPALASASGSVWDELDAAMLDLSVMDDDAFMLDIENQTVARPPHHGPGYRPAPRPPRGPAYHRPAPPRYVPKRVHSHRTEIVVVEQPQTTSVVETTSAEPAVERIGSRLGFGLRLLGNKQSDYITVDGQADSNRIAPGFGWYIKVRPSRWVSIEFQNDYQFGKIADAENIYRVPLTLGLQFHVFDYGDLDLYGVAAGGVTIVSFDDCDSYNRDHYIQWGGQFGAGISFILGTFELGFDLRYTIDQAPEDHKIYYDDGDVGYTNYDQNQIVHGVTFALNLGFAL